MFDIVCGSGMGFASGLKGMGLDPASQSRGGGMVLH